MAGKVATSTDVWVWTRETPDTWALRLKGRSKPFGYINRAETWSIPEAECTAATKYEYHVQIGSEASWIGHELQYAKNYVLRTAKDIHAKYLARRKMQRLYI